MSDDRRTGLRLGELLALGVIASALSCLLLPVFARARSQARMAVCLGNIRTIVRAMRMYLDDTDARFPPRETDPEVIEYFNTRPGGGATAQWNPATAATAINTDIQCKSATFANPYLRWPVILDSYLPNRQVWRCPDAILEDGAHFINGAHDWLGHLKAHEGQWGLYSKGYLCPGNNVCWPGGWGGTVTDTLLQGRLALPELGGELKSSPGLFVQSIGTTEMAVLEPRSPTVAIEDPAWFVLCADGGGTTNDYCTGALAYPDLCGLECAASETWGYGADWEHCPWSKTCGASPAMLVDKSLRQPHARHFGGVNIGFLDGHAQWFDSEEVIRLSRSHGDYDRGKLRGYGPWGPTRDAPWYDPRSGAPTLY